MAESFGFGAFGGGGTTVTPSTGTTGWTARRIPFGSAAGTLTQDSPFFYDSTANQLNVQSGTLSDRTGLFSGAILVTDTAASQIGFFGAEGNWSGGASTDIAFGSLNAMVFHTGGTTAAGIFINSTQGVGVGTTTPSGRMEIQGTSNSEVLRVSGFSSAGTTLGPILVAHSTGSTSKIGFWTTAGSTRAAAITTQTAGATDTASLRTAVNDLIAVLKNIGMTA